MGRRKGSHPAYRRHKQSGQAIVSLPIGGGKYRDILLGPYDSPQSHEAYLRVLHEWLACNHNLPPKSAPTSHFTVAELCLRFWLHAEVHYRLADGTPSFELNHFELALRPLKELYLSTRAVDFGPVALKAVRQRMIDGNSLARKTINQRIDHIKRVFRWAVSEELNPPSTYQALQAVAGLRRGHQGTREQPRVKPVPSEHVEATLPYLRPQVAAMVQVQRLIGARSTEICMLRGRNIDSQSGSDVWWYRIDPNEVPREGPANLHKTAHHEATDGTAVVKILPIGPQAQAILKPWLREDPDEFLFQPGEAREALAAERRNKRKTPMTPSQRKRMAKAAPQRAPRTYYDRHSYGRAIARACKKAGVPHWHPHQLKHLCGTEIRKEFGLEAARTFLGHAHISTSELYAEKDYEIVERIAKKMR